MTAISELGDTILEREFEAVDADGNQSIITFRIGTPFKDSALTGVAKWRCAYQITGIGLEKVHFAMGVDAIDALMTCIQLGEIVIRSYQKSRTITFWGEENLRLIPLSVEELSEERQKEIQQDADNPFKKIYDEFFRNAFPTLKQSDEPE